MQCSTMAPNFRSLTPIEMTTASISRPPASRCILNTCGPSAGPALGLMPAYGPSMPVSIDAPEHARCAKVTEVLGSAFSIARAVWAWYEYAERSHCNDCHLGASTAGRAGDGTSGAPSPEPFESPNPKT